jgi:hypothetical protein
MLSSVSNCECAVNSTNKILYDILNYPLGLK